MDGVMAGLVQKMLERKLRKANEKLLLYRALHEITEWQDLVLETTCRFENLATAFRLHHEMPEIDVRDELDIVISELRDQVARLEEQIVA